MIKIDINKPGNCLKCPMADRLYIAIYCRAKSCFVRGKSKRPKNCPIA